MTSIYLTKAEGQITWRSKASIRQPLQPLQKTTLNTLTAIVFSLRQITLGEKEGAQKVDKKITFKFSLHKNFFLWDDSISIMFHFRNDINLMV